MTTNTPASRHAPEPELRKERIRGLFAIPVAAILLVAAVGAAAVALQFLNATTIEARDSPIAFEAGDDYAAINQAGYASFTATDGGARASMTLYGVPGAASLAVTDLLKLTNQDADAQSYLVTLSRDAALPASVTSLTVTVRNATGVAVDTVDFASTAQGSAFTLAYGDSFDIDATIVVASGTGTGSLGTFNLVASATKV